MKVFVSALLILFSTILCVLTTTLDGWYTNSSYSWVASLSVISCILSALAVIVMGIIEIEQG